MKILFSPSEEKRFIYKNDKNTEFAFLKNLLFYEMQHFRKEVLFEYLNYLRQATSNQIAKILGNKKIDMDLLMACSNLSKANTANALSLYNGVAFKALDIATLPKECLLFLFENVIIFSNLFGPIRAKDEIPYYKFKQGEKFKQYNIKTIHKSFQKKLDEYLNNEKILDLRAEVYIQAYEPNIATNIVEFYKNNKKISHYSKFYRGILLREIALKQGDLDVRQIKSQHFYLKNIKKMELRTILQYEVI